MSGEAPERSPEYYVLKDGDIFGPFTEDELRAGLADGRFLATDFVQADNQPSWEAWEPVHWPRLYADADQINHISQLTDDIVSFLNALRTKKQPDFATETLRRPATDWLAKMGEKHLSENDRLSATQGFMNALRSMVRSDVIIADSQVHYAYFRNKLKDEQRDRDGLYKAFDAQCAELASPSTRKAYH